MGGVTTPPPPNVEKKSGFSPAVCTGCEPAAISVLNPLGDVDANVVVASNTASANANATAASGRDMLADTTAASGRDMLDA